MNKFFKNNQTKGIFITSLGVIAFVPDSLLIRLIEADILTTALYKGLLSGLLITFWCVIFMNSQLKSFIRSPKFSGIIYIIFHGIGNLLFITAIELTSVANALFIISTSPIFSAIFSRIFLKEKFEIRVFFTILGALLGIAVIAFSSSYNPNTSLLGDLAALGVAICLGVSLTAARSAANFSMIPATGISALILGIILLLFLNPFIISTYDFYLILILIFMNSLGTSLLATGPRYITSAEVGLILLMEAVLAPVLIWIVIGENPGIATLRGGAIVLFVLIISNIIALKQLHN